MNAARPETKPCLSEGLSSSAVDPLETPVRQRGALTATVGAATTVSALSASAASALSGLVVISSGTYMPDIMRPAPHRGPAPTARLHKAVERFMYSISSAETLINALFYFLPIKLSLRKLCLSPANDRPIRHWHAVVR